MAWRVVRRKGGQGVKVMGVVFMECDGERHVFAMSMEKSVKPVLLRLGPMTAWEDLCDFLIYFLSSDLVNGGGSRISLESFLACSTS